MNKKALSKTLSSPGRSSDKFPPPLLRFLRSNVGTRSRGRSRASPMFYLRPWKNTPAVISTTQTEPSSPTVTCIGQVRVRRASKSKSKSRKTSSSSSVKRRRCWWLRRKPKCCWGRIKFRVPKRPFRRIIRKVCSCFRFCCYCNKKVDDADNNSRNRKCEKNNVSENRSVRSCESPVAQLEDEETRKDSLVESSCSSSPPPTNALMLTRCRSAPYRSSSLGGIFWGSALKESEESKDNGNEVKLEKPEPEVKVIVKEELEGTVGKEVHVLTRCKSEPASIGERLLLVDSDENKVIRLDDHSSSSS